MKRATPALEKESDPRMTDNTSPPQSTNRWYSILGFQFSRQQAIRAAKLLAAGGVAFCVAFAAWYIPPRATSLLIWSVGGAVNYRHQNVPNTFVARFLLQSTRMVGLTATDEEIESVQLTQLTVTDDWLHHLKTLEGLKHLHIHERQLGPGLADLAEFSELTHIAVWHLCSGDLGHLQQLPNLTGVSLVQAACADVDLSKLALLPKLNWVEFISTPLTARQFEQLAQIKTLNSINIAHGKLDAAGQEGIAHLAKLPSLQFLYINDVTDETAAVLAKIESLTYLMIDRSNLTDDGAAALAKLTKLQNLQLQQCVRPIDIEALRKQMPKCQINYSVRQSPTR